VACAIRDSSGFGRILLFSIRQMVEAAVLAIAANLFWGQAVALAPHRERMRRRSRLVLVHAASLARPATSDQLTKWLEAGSKWLEAGSADRKQHALADRSTFGWRLFLNHNLRREVP
jgi:hypothetical protein